MEATNPLRRLLLAVALGAAGCSSTGAGNLPYSNAVPGVFRSQAPPDPAGPIPPVAPPPPTAPTSPPPSSVTPAVAVGPVQGQPVPAGFSTGTAGILKPLVSEGIPRVKIAAVVGKGNFVTDEEVWELVRQRMDEYIRDVEVGNERVRVRDDAKEKELYADALIKTIHRELILDDMYARLKKNGKLQVIDEIREFAGKMAERQLREFKKIYRARSDEELQSILTPQGLTIPVIRRQIERQIMADEYVRSMMKERGMKPGLTEIRVYYDTHPDEFKTVDRVKWLDLFVSFNKFATPRDAYDHAEKIRGQAAGGADFVELVKAHDHGVAARQNGEGIGSKRGEIRPADVEPAVWALPPGQVSGLVETPAGYHVVKVVERDNAGVRPFDQKVQTEIREKLMKKMHEQEYKRLVEDLWRKGAVQVMDGK